MRAWMSALALVLVVACKKQEAAAPPPDDDTAKPMPAAEVKRGQDACASYVTRVCACTAEPAKPACSLAKALPEAIETALQVANNPETRKLDALQAQDLVRKTVKECIEQTAKLPSLGCE